MKGLTVRWSLAAAGDGVDADLAAYVADTSHARFTGMAGLRWALVTASTSSLPALICGSAEGRLSNIRSMLPDTRSSRAGPEPR